MVSITTRGRVLSNIHTKIGDDDDDDDCCPGHVCSSNLFAHIRVFHTRHPAALCGTPLVHQPWRQRGGQSCDQGYQAAEASCSPRVKMEESACHPHFK